MKLKKLIKIIIFVIVLGIGIALIVHFNADKIVSEITADGMLGYIASYFSSAATICLTLYALHQTNHANKMIEKANKSAEESAKQANELTVKANEIAEKLNKIAEESIAMAKQANELTEKANEIAEKSIAMAQQSNKIAENAYVIEKYNYQLQIRPFIIVNGYEIANYSQEEILYSNKIVFYEAGEWDSISNINGIKFKITNTTDAFLTFAFNEAICKKDNSIRWNNNTAGYNNCKNGNISLMAGESKEIVFIVDEQMLINLEKKTLTMSFILGNLFAEKYEEKFEIWFVHMLNNNLSIKYLLRFQNFQIEPIDSDKDEI